MVTSRKRGHDSDRNKLRGLLGRMVPILARRVLSLSPPTRFAMSVVLVVLVAALDRITGAEISFSIFYLVPVSFAAGSLSLGAGRVVAFLSAFAWGYLEITGGYEYSAEWIPFWNSAVRLAFFLLATELVHRLRDAHERVRALARTDTLTGIANGRVFMEQAGQAIAQARRSGLAMTLTYIDLDRFKEVNDQYGHAEGDRLLRVVAETVAEGVRATDVAARLGGDEFGILMPDTDAEQARVCLERISEEIAHKVGERWSVGATFGAVTFREPPSSVDCAVLQADHLMYRGKEEALGGILQATWPESGSECDQPRPDV